MAVVVTTFELLTTDRPYRDPFACCNFCGECLQRCPAGAIKLVGRERKAGMDRTVCQDYLDNKIKPRFKPRYGCGKCQTAVQCEQEIPRS